MSLATRFLFFFPVVNLLTEKGTNGISYIVLHCFEWTFFQSLLNFIPETLEGVVHFFRMDTDTS